jgi:hypothetical protein
LTLSALVVAVSACSSAATETSTSSSTATTVAEGAATTTTAVATTVTTAEAGTTETTSDRPVAPDFTLQLGDGGTYTLSEGSKPVYLVFWAEW